MTVYKQMTSNKAVPFIFTDVSTYNSKRHKQSFTFLFEGDTRKLRKHCISSVDSGVWIGSVVTK
jgi:hypothetical protein